MSTINRRGFLKLFGMGLAAAGVSASTISVTFPAEEARGEEPDKMAVAEALRKVVNRQKETGKIDGPALSALRILAEAHRDFSFVWAAAGVTLYAHLGGSMSGLCRTMRANCKDTLIGNFLSRVKRELFDKYKNASDEETRCRTQLEIAVAYGEMAGLSPSQSVAGFESIAGHHTMEWFQKNDPDALKAAFGPL
jgi:hypothetical protein